MKFDTVKIVDRIRANLISIVVVSLAVYMAAKVAVLKEKELKQLRALQETELQKNKKMEEIATLEKELAAVSKVVNAKSVEVKELYTRLDKFAKEAQVKIVMKPPEETSTKDSGYKKVTIGVTLTADKYHQLGKFIDLIEHAPDIFFIESMDISGRETQKKDAGISASITLSTIVIEEQG